VLYKFRALQLGAGIRNGLSPTFQALNYSFKAPLMLSFNSSYTWDISPEWTLRPLLLTVLPSHTIPAFGLFTVDLNYSLLYFALGARTGGGILTGGGVKDIHYDKVYMSLGFMFFHGTALSNALNRNQFEIMLRFYDKK
jgi:hypothetical protein